MNCLIVYAHPEPKSFNAALRDAACQELRRQGHSVEVSDLYAMNFKPVVDRTDFLTCHDASHFNVSLEQRKAHVSGGLAPDIAGELAPAASRFADPAVSALVVRDACHFERLD